MIQNKKEFLRQYPDFAPGVHVYGKNNEPLGRIIALSDDFITIEKGVFFPKDFMLRYDEAEEFREGKLYVNKSLSDLREWKDEAYEGWEQVENINRGKLTAVPTEPYRQRYESIREETVRIPLYEEELEAKKVSQQTGEVRLRKIVHTELKHVTIPVDHEDVQIERTLVGRRNADENEVKDAFQERTVSMPVMDEDVVVGKHAVLKEEVQIKKTHRMEERDISGEVRTEDVEILNEGTAQKQRSPSEQDVIKKKAG